MIKKIRQLKQLKQYDIDNGQIGGFLSIFTQSMFIFSIANFLGISALVYQSILRNYVPIWIFLIFIIIGYFGWMAIYYSILMPSMIRFSNRQGYAHGNPMREDITFLKKELKEIREDIMFLKKELEIRKEIK